MACRIGIAYPTIAAREVRINAADHVEYGLLDSEGVSRGLHKVVGFATPSKQDLGRKVVTRLARY